MPARYCSQCGSSRLYSSGKTPVGKQRWECADCHNRSIFTDKKPVAKIKHEQKTKYKKYLITCAQNATPVFMPFLKSLEVYAKEIKARIVVIPIRYHNPTSIWTEENQSEDWWAQEILPYLMNQKQLIGKHLEVRGDISIQPTSGVPLSGMEGLSKDRSAIFGHPRLELKSVPTPHLALPKVITTTGTITKKNYVPSKAGSRASFYHMFGAILVEEKKGSYYLRQITAKKDGSFIDLDKSVTTKGVVKAPRAEAVVLGDLHQEFMSPAVDRATFTAEDSIVSRLKPKYCVFHDSWDGFAANPHHIDRALSKGVKVLNFRDRVGNSVDKLFEYLNKRIPKQCNFVLAASNHDDFLRRWLEATDPRSDPVNASIWCELYSKMLKGGIVGEGGIYLPNPLQLYYEGRKANWPNLKGKLKFLERGESFRKLNTEMSYHGDRGAGGSRGSSKQFGSIASKTITGHSHSVKIYGGNFQVGTSSDLHMDYTVGQLNSNVNAHCVLYANGTRSLIMILLDGTWEAA